MSLETSQSLEFEPFTSVLNPGFWQQLMNVKLNKLKLSQDPLEIRGTYSCNLSDNLPCLASFDSNSFGDNAELGTKYTNIIYGQVVCFNTMQEFVNYDKRMFLNSLGRHILESIEDGRALKDPERHLSRFGLLVYADLKKYKFYYWFNFPSVKYPAQVQLINQRIAISGEATCKAANFFSPISEIFLDGEVDALQVQYEEPSKDRNFQRGYFIVRHFINENTQKSEIRTYSLDRYPESISKIDGEQLIDAYFAYSDPSPKHKSPGWNLRNYICLISVQYKLKNIKFIRIRKSQSGSIYNLSTSMAFEVSIDQDTQEALQPTIVGWEKNESNKLVPKKVDLSNLLDSKKLAEDAVNLNLRLMKWRLLPDLDLDSIAETKCLLLGCGTLGCNVARGLLAWGVKKMTIVDNSKISYSNPVRQTLYNFEDCSKANGQFKAEAAAASLRRIHPTVNVEAHVLSIPMPGHHVSENMLEQTKQDVAKLEKLIDDNDAIFLLMDTRESRWLPTVIAMSKQKLVINAAIGFDTFLLQRYGKRRYDECPSENKCLDVNNFLPSDKLGCYFCNDIVAPGDSTIDRTLDQQCTVSRPGVSMMVSAMAVELLASIVSSRRKADTPAPIEVTVDPSMMHEEESGSELGIVPHSIRGNLARYYIYMPTSPCFNKCSACSHAVVHSYRSSGFDFLHKVFEDPNYLEEVAGLKDLQTVSDNVWALDSDDEIEDIELMGQRD